ncbi:MAG: hypothetical protein NT062_19290 [Proteobacteria bacterium]|nr:hypothetical protein [Pseudomonadota bacterium]
MTPGQGLVILCGLAGCLPDDGRCGPNMKYVDALGVCVCSDHAISDGGGCTSCAADEIVVGNTCACPPGEARNANDACAAVAGFGAACDAQTPCSNPTYSVCAVREGTGTCAHPCAVDTDCPASDVCADWEPLPSCRTYTGYGATCTNANDCASYDATACLQGHCVVDGCTVGVDDCPRDTTCCDLSSYGLGTVCTPPGSCP